MTIHEFATGVQVIFKLNRLLTLLILLGLTGCTGQSYKLVIKNESSDTLRINELSGVADFQPCELAPGKSQGLSPIYILTKVQLTWYFVGKANHLPAIKTTELDLTEVERKNSKSTLILKCNSQRTWTAEFDE